VRFKKRLTIESGLRQIDIAPLIDCVFLLLIFFMLTSNFIVVPGINVKLPKAVTSEGIKTRTVTLMISSEDIVYVDGVPRNMDEVSAFLENSDLDSVFIKSDRDASIGIVVGVWDICKKLGIEKIGIATTYQQQD